MGLNKEEKRVYDLFKESVLSICGEYGISKDQMNTVIGGVSFNPTSKEMICDDM